MKESLLIEELRATNGQFIIIFIYELTVCCSELFNCFLGLLQIYKFMNINYIYQNMFKFEIIIVKNIYFA